MTQIAANQRIGVLEMEHEIDMTDFREALAWLSATLDTALTEGIEPGSRVRRVADSRAAGNREPDTALDRAEQRVRDEFNEMVKTIIGQADADYTDVSAALATTIVVDAVRRIYGEAVATFVTTDPATWALATDPASPFATAPPEVVRALLGVPAPDDPTGAARVAARDSSGHRRPVGRGTRAQRPVRARYEIRNSVATDVAVIDLMGDIGPDGVSSADFVRDLRKVTAGEIELHINSDGGSVFDGLTIYNAVKNHRARVTVIVD
ncbi:ATP-dependent Clp protease proteolytic subunit, partial [Frankia sp. EI5c]|uniref:ATP-dependent Clp protease proteolytic subunit n=1 Tax=Frankia sp. EI5c TaxID=683316 RepID=UPI001F5BA0BE